MMAERRFLLVDADVLPEVFVKVLQAKELLASGAVSNISAAAKQAGISRSAFYKYKDDIFPFHENEKGRTVTMVIQLDDTPGVMAELLNAVARYQANILTIHQSIPINGIASLTLSVDVLPETGDVTQMVASIEEQTGIHYVKILGRE